MSGRVRPGRESAPADTALADTIVAPASAAGPGERAIVRLSGARAEALLDRVVQVEQPPRPGRSGRGRIPLGGGAELPVMLLCWHAPRSLTGEDVVEIHLPGWPCVVTELVRRLVAVGARPADRGEFTRRAVVLGRMDLAQAQAVGRLVGADTPEEAQAAAAVLAGGLARLHDELRERLLATLALIEAHVDFEEEDTEAVSEDAVREGLERARDLARRLLAGAGRAPAADGETDVVLLGPTNAGKSLLFTALCPGACTTVSAVAGTTRDALEARVTRAGRRFRLLDGPGIDFERVDVSDLDRRAMQHFLAGLPLSAVVLLVEDGAAPLTDAARARLAARAGTRALVHVLNKVDRLVGSELHRRAGLPVSALCRSGLEALWDAILEAAPVPRAPDDATAAECAAAADIVPVLDDTLTLDVAASLPLVSWALHDALQRLDAERQMGTDVREDVLDRVFAGFCIGK